VLPIELLSFEGDAIGSVNVLRWVTGSEHQSDRFDVQRSENGSTFAPIGSIDAAGNSSSMLDYRFTDAAPPNGTAFYRLLMVDLDGSMEEGPVVAIHRASDGLRLRPNPVQDLVEIVLPAFDGPCVLRLLDPSGRCVAQATGTGGGMLSMDLGSLASGLYEVIVHAADGSRLQSGRLIKR
jgi:hypothetical protein